MPFVSPCGSAGGGEGSEAARTAAPVAAMTSARDAARRAVDSAGKEAAVEVKAQLHSHELTITLANVLEVDPVQFSINVPLGERPSLSDEPSAVVVKGLKLVPAPEEEEEDVPEGM